MSISEATKKILKDKMEKLIELNPDCNQELIQDILDEK